MCCAYSPENSLERPWILYEAGVAKGKLDIPVHGLAIGVPLSRVSTGLILASMARESCPWLYTMSVEIYRAALDGNRRKNQIAIDKLYERSRTSRNCDAPHP